MNLAARSLGMHHTRYTDPSGYDDATVSTAADQVRIAGRPCAAGVRGIVATPSATLPVAGTVHNTDSLLGHDGFVGVKTGSDDAAGGCFAFRAIRRIHGKRTTITGVVLGQAGGARSRRGSRPPTPWSTASPVDVPETRRNSRRSGRLPPSSGHVVWIYAPGVPGPIIFIATNRLKPGAAEKERGRVPGAGAVR